jgi:methylase of polypeptide subunit release factors
MQNLSDSSGRHLSDFRTKKHQYQLTVNKYTCNKFGLAELLSRHFDELSLPHCSSALDVGAGVGPISVFLANEYNVDVTAIEINPVAHNCCLENISKYSLEKKINLIAEDFSNSTTILSDSRFDLIVANPPIGPLQDESAAYPSCSEQLEREIDLEFCTFLTNAWVDAQGMDLVDHIFRFSDHGLSNDGHIILACCDIDVDCVGYIQHKMKKYSYTQLKRIDTYVSPESIGARSITSDPVGSYIFVLKKRVELLNNG